MAVIVLLVLAILLSFAMFAVVGSVIGLILTLFMAGLIGWGADAVVPGRLPGGWLGAVLAGIVGGILGNLIFRLLGMRGFGPEIFNVDIIPAFVGAVVIAFGFEWFGKREQSLS
jgi:uncharacterized membrane protein YeaQ/YmgE (transglycosylase-associated protein family)